MEVTKWLKPSDTRRARPPGSFNLDKIQKQFEASIAGK